MNLIIFIRKLSEMNSFFIYLITYYLYIYFVILFFKWKTLYNVTTNKKLIIIVSDNKQ